MFNDTVRKLGSDVNFMMGEYKSPGSKVKTLEGRVTAVEMVAGLRKS